MARVFLTARRDLLVSDQGLGDDIDSIVRISSDADPREKLFGVIHEGTSTPFQSKEDATQYLNSWKAHRTLFKQFPFPVLILAFSMINDAGYYAWQAEPVVFSKGAPRLKVHDHLVCERANRAALNKIVERASKWNEQF